jgi:GNAT superfamily N-acetyltransferase
MDQLVRQYRSGDFDPVTQLWRRSREVSLPGFQREKGYPFEMDQAYFKDHILAKDEVWIAETQTTSVGFMATHEDLIDHLYVDPGHWRQGIGKMLLDHAKTRSPQHLWLYTLQVNLKARVFYVKNGFVASKFGISPPPELEPDVEYHWKPK